ncbi:MAG: hypothetical protein ACRENF_08660 [Thermodesulfobacteriota bacterium]
MFKNVKFVMLTGAVMAVFFSPIYIESAPSVKKEYVKKEPSKKKKKGGCSCSK